MTQRRVIHGWSVRWSEDRARHLREQGWWSDDTVADLAPILAQEEPERLMLVDGETRVTTAALYDHASRLAKEMIARGLGLGDTISFMLPNWHEAAAIYLAATLAGLVVHPIVPAMRDRELAFMLEDAKSRMVFIPHVFRGHDYPAMLARATEGLVSPPEIVVLRGDAGPHLSYDALLSGQHDGLVLPKVDPDSVKLVLYTSGTTGRPKAVLHSHNTIGALVRQIRLHWRVERSSKFFVPSPISHIGGSIYAFEFPFLCGSVAVLQDIWNADEAARILDKERCTHMAAATPFLQQLLAAARARKTNLPSLSVFICGGASVPPSLIRDANGYFSGCTVSRVFGLTEVPVVTVGAMRPGDLDHAAETDGHIGAAEVRILDPFGHPAKVEGEICVRGPQMLAGYLHMEDERSAFDAEGFFHTGDLGFIVDGDYVVVTGRGKDIIIRLGENIAPKEIEDILVDHPDIAEIAVVGLPDPRTGERACAVVVPKPGAGPDVASLRSYLDARRIARFKIPEQVELWPSLPRNSAGKILKHKIRDELIARGGKSGVA